MGAILYIVDPQVQEAVPAPKVPNKKVLIGALLFLAVIIVFILITMISGSQSSKESASQNIPQQATTNSQTGNLNNANQNDSQSAVIDQLADWKSYQNSQFSLKYPQDWQTQEVKFPNGDLGVSLRPVLTASTNPSMLIVNITSDAVTSSQQQQSYLSQGFNKSSITLDSAQAIKLSGTFPPKSASSAASANAIQAKHIYFKRGNSDYLLKYSYIDKGQNQDLEILFNKIISSFRMTN